MRHLLKVAVLSCLCAFNVAQGQDWFPPDPTDEYPSVSPVTPAPVPVADDRQGKAPALLIAADYTTVAKALLSSLDLVAGRISNHPLSSTSEAATVDLEKLLSVIQQTSANDLTVALSQIAEKSPDRILELLADLKGHPVEIEAVLSIVTLSDNAPAVANALLVRINAQTLHSDLTSIDGELLVVAEEFASHDPRFKAINPFSAYGRRLSVLKRKISANGGEMTPNLRAEMIQIYKEAEADLAQYVSRHPLKH